MEKKTRFFGALGGMFKGLVHPAEYIKTGKKCNMVFHPFVGDPCMRDSSDVSILYAGQQEDRI